MESDTPRTDAESPNLWVVPAEFAKQLERELAAAIKERDEAVELYTDLLRRLSGSTLPRHAFLSGDASEKEWGGA